MTDDPQTQRQLTFYHYYHDIFKPLGANRKKILEVGCGRGTIIQYFARDGKRVYGIDSNPEAVTLAKQNFTQAALQGILEKGSAEQLRFNNKYFDMSVSVGLLEHCDNWQDILKEQYRVLKRGGLLAFINVPHKFSIQTFFKKNDHWHRNETTAEEYADTCKELGFRQVNCYHLNPFPLIGLDNDERREQRITDTYKKIWKVRQLFLKNPMVTNKVVAQCHILLAIK